MNDKNVIKKQLLKNMITTFIAFSIIFATFSTIIYNQVQTTMYRSVDNEVMMYLNRDDKTNKKDKFNLNPRIIYILRDKNGNILNPDSIGRFYEDYLVNVPFNTNNLNQVFNLVIDGQYNYRSVIQKVVSENNDIAYVQLLANVDAEAHVLKRFTMILIFSSTIAIVISIIASYILSRRTIKPIVNSWEKQTQFVQDASHELRTPLTIIQAKLEMLLQKPESKIIQNTEDIRISLNETKRLTKLIKDLMILARGDSKNYEITKQNTNIDKVIMDISVPYKEFAHIDNKNFVLNLEYRKNLDIDINKINQLMIILLDNAIKYTEAGDTIEIHTYGKEGKCVIEVKDTGIGIDENSVKHIFDRFYRADKARTRESGGTGLGLSIANWIVNVHGGTIKANHNTPKGTIFTIKI